MQPHREIPCPSFSPTSHCPPHRGVDLRRYWSPSHRLWRLQSPVVLLGCSEYRPRGGEQRGDSWRNDRSDRSEALIHHGPHKLTTSNFANPDVAVESSVAHSEKLFWHRYETQDDWQKYFLYISTFFPLSYAVWPYSISSSLCGEVPVCLHGDSCQVWFKSQFHTDREVSPNLIRVISYAGPTLATFILALMSSPCNSSWKVLHKCSLGSLSYSIVVIGTDPAEVELGTFA